MSQTTSWIVAASGGTLPASSGTLCVRGGSELSLLVTAQLAPGAIPPAPAIDVVVSTGQLSETVKLGPGARSAVLVGVRQPKLPAVVYANPAPNPSTLPTFPPPVPSDQFGRPIGGATTCSVTGISVALATPPPPPAPTLPSGQEQPEYELAITVASASAPDGLYFFSASSSPAPPAP